MRVDAVFFDLDGTLVDTTDLILASCSHTFERHLGMVPSRAAIVATFGRSLPEVLLEVAKDAGATDPAGEAAAMLATYRAHNDGVHDELIKPFAGIDALLSALAGEHIRLGVVTSKRERSARRGLARYDFESRFDVLVFHDDTIRHKPDPAPLLLASERAGVRPARCAYVGDSVHDIAAGHAAGMLTVAALWGPFARADLEAAGPHAMAASPSDVLRILRTAADHV
jgi:pyrophosphatase PpaX